MKSKNQPQWLTSTYYKPRESKAIIVVAAVTMVALAIVTWNLIDRSEKQVDEIKSVKIVSMADPSRAESKAAERKSTDKQALLACRAHPLAKKLSFEELALTDRGLRHLQSMTQLEDLHLGGTEITDKGLAYIERLPLKILIVSSTGITSEGLKSISKIKTLATLDAEDTQVTEEGLWVLKELPNLTHLNLSATKIGARGLEYVSEIPTLVELKLACCTELKEQDLSAIKKLPALAQLDLRGIPLTVTGTKMLASIPSLTNIDLEQTGLTDEAVKPLISAPQITSLSLSKTKITDKTLSDLKNSQHIGHVELNQCPNITEKAVTQLRTSRPLMGMKYKPCGQTIDPDAEFHKFLEKQRKE